EAGIVGTRPVDRPGELFGEIARHGGNVDAHLFEHFALHQPAHSAARVGVALLLALPGEIVEARVGARLAFDCLELGADAVSQALEPLLRAGGIGLPVYHSGSLPKPPGYGKGAAWFPFRSPSSFAARSSA